MAAVGQSARDSTPSPSDGAAVAHAGDPSRARPAREPRPQLGQQLRLPAGPEHTDAGPHSQPAPRAWDGGPPARHATARLWPDTPDRRRASRHCAAVRARSSMRPAPAGGPSPAPHSLGLATTQSPRALQTTGTAPMAASTMAQISSVASRPPSGTSGPPPLATRRALSLPPRSIGPRRSLPRTAAGSRAEPCPAGQVTAAIPFVVPDPSAVA